MLLAEFITCAAVCVVLCNFVSYRKGRVDRNVETADSVTHTDISLCNISFCEV